MSVWVFTFSTAHVLWLSDKSGVSQILVLQGLEPLRPQFTELHFGIHTCLMPLFQQMDIGPQMNNTEPQFGKLSFIAKRGPSSSSNRYQMRPN